MYIMAPEPISTAYFINPSNQSVRLFVYPPIVAKQQLGEHVPAATNRRNSRTTVGPVIFCAVHVVSKESLCASLCILLSLLGNGSVDMLPRQRRIVVGIIFFKYVPITL
jgi:hypothetical protein